MAEDETPTTGEGGPEAAQVHEVPPNVVKDNSGVVPVWPVATSDPTINDNTNPKIPFDGANPRNIPPQDSNEQLHIAADKRARAESAGLATAAAARKKAVEAAYDNSKDVRDVIGDQAPNVIGDPGRDESLAGRIGNKAGDGDKGGASADDKPPASARNTPPQNRSAKPTTKA